MDLNYTSVTEHIIGASDASANNDASEIEEASDIDDVSDTEEASAIDDTSVTEDNQPHENYSPNDPMDDLSSPLSLSSAHLNWEASEPDSPITSDDEYYSPTATRSYTIKE